MLKDRVIIDEDGSIEGTDTDAKRLIRKLGLDSPDYREFRQLIIGMVALAKAHNDTAKLHKLLSYPAVLPNLSKKRPENNSRPEGIAQSCYARRQRDELPETY